MTIRPAPPNSVVRHCATDTANPTEIAYLDRGPINTPNPTGLNLGGYWSTYWYNGQIYGTEIARGFDTFGLKTSSDLSANELAAATAAAMHGRKTLLAVIEANAH